MPKLGEKRAVTENTVINMDKQGIVHLSFQEGSYINLNESKKILSSRKKWLSHPSEKQLLLVDFTNNPVPSQQSKDHARSDDVEKLTKAMACIVKGKISQIVGSFFIQMKEVHYPTKLFRNKKEAIGWLLSQ
jgi:hypothetical protein